MSVECIEHIPGEIISPPWPLTSTCLQFGTCRSPAFPRNCSTASPKPTPHTHTGACGLPRHFAHERFVRMVAAVRRRPIPSAARTAPEQQELVFPQSIPERPDFVIDIRMRFQRTPCEIQTCNKGAAFVPGVPYRFNLRASILGLESASGNSRTLSLPAHRPRRCCWLKLNSRLRPSCRQMPCRSWRPPNLC